MDPNATHPPSTPNNQHNFLLNWNIRSVHNNIDELKIILTQTQPTIVTLQEAYSSKHLFNDPLLNNYTWITKPAVIPKHTVCLGILKHIPFENVTLQTDLPAIAIQIKTPIEVTIVCIYLTPSDRLAPNLQLSLDNLLNQIAHPLMLVGDFNAQHKDWGCAITNSRGTLLQDTFENNLTQVLYHKAPTRLSPDTGKLSSLDHCATSYPIVPHFSIQVMDDLHGSDHFPMIIQCNRNTPPTTIRPRWKYDKANWEDYQKALNAFP